MRVLMGVIKDRHNTYYALKTVPAKPKGLRAAVALELKNGKSSQANLKRSLGTKDLRQANIRAKPVLAEFDRLIAKARARLTAADVPLVVRTTLSDIEIKRMAEYLYADTMTRDAGYRSTGREVRKRDYEEAVRFFGITDPERIPDNEWPQYGVHRQVALENKAFDLDTLRLFRQCAATGDISCVQDHVLEVMVAFDVEVDPHSAAYIKLGNACLHSYIRALEDIGKRDQGLTVDAPALVSPRASAAAEAGTLQDALEGWKRHRARPERTVFEFSRSIQMFVQLHGNMAVAEIKKRHALEYRKALQDVPRHRTGDLLRATLPAQAEWGREHPEAVKLNAATINKQLGAVQSVCVWAHDNGLVPDDVTWSDPFSRMGLPVERSKRKPYEVEDMHKLFGSAIYTRHDFPLGAHGAAGFWVPILAAFTGGRLAEVCWISTADVQLDLATGAALLYFVEEKARGKSVKTDRSERAMTVHPQLVQLGFLSYVQARREADGDKAWLFPEVAPSRGRAGVPAFSQWWGRYRKSVGVDDPLKVFHSFRHGFQDRLRDTVPDEELREAIQGRSKGASVGRDYGAKEMVARWGVTKLKTAIDSINYPGLDLSRVKPLGVPLRTRGNTKAT